MTCSNFIKVKRQLVTPERKNYVLFDLAMHDWSIILNDNNVNSQVRSLHKIIDTRSTNTVRHDKPEWITPTIEMSIKARDV